MNDMSRNSGTRRVHRSGDSERERPFDDWELRNGRVVKARISDDFYKKHEARADAERVARANLDRVHTDEAATNSSSTIDDWRDSTYQQIIDSAGNRHSGSADEANRTYLADPHHDSDGLEDLKEVTSPEVDDEIEDEEKSIISHPGESMPPRFARPTRAAIRLTDWAMRFLPAEARERYDEEIQSELYDLASAGQSRWQQVKYGLRLLPRMVLLHRAVSTQRERAR